MQGGKDRENYRFGVLFIPVSWVAEQFFCELKLEHELTLGRETTESMITGAEMHDEILEMEEASEEEIIQMIKKRKSFVASFPLVGYVNELLLIGIPDAIYFKRGKPRYVIELKTTSSGNLRVWRGQVVQVMLYGLLLDEMGFNTDNLDLLILKLRQDEELLEETKDQLIGTLIGYAERGRLDKIEQEFDKNIRVYSVKYSRDAAVDIVRWASDYWLMRRDAIPTKKPSKCKVCEFKITCPRSLVLPSP